MRPGGASLVKPLSAMSTRPLELVRMATAAVVLCVYGLLGADYLMLYGPGGWLDVQTARAMNPSPWVQSLLFHVQTDAQAWAFLAAFLLADLALLVGWRTAWVKWLVLAGQVWTARYEGLDQVQDVVVRFR